MQTTHLLLYKWGVPLPIDPTHVAKFVALTKVAGDAHKHYTRAKEGKAGATEDLAAALGLEFNEVRQMLFLGRDALERDPQVAKQAQALIEQQAPKDVTGGTKAGQTLQSHGRFGVIGGPGIIARGPEGAPPRSIAVSVAGLPKSRAYETFTAARTELDRSLPASVDPENPGKWDLYPMGSEYTREMVLGFTADASKKVHEQLQRHTPPIEFAAVDTILLNALSEATKRIDAERKSPSTAWEYEDFSSNQLLGKLARHTADAAAEIVGRLDLPSDRGLKIEEYGLRQFMKAAFIKGSFKAFTIDHTGGRGAVHEVLSKHGAEKALPPDRTL